MKRILMVYDQIQSGYGTKEQRMLPLEITRDLIGPAARMERVLRKYNLRVVGCISCGAGVYIRKPDEVLRKIAGLARLFRADAVICGPCFRYGESALMSASAAKCVQNRSGIAAIAWMSRENERVIFQYHRDIPIVDCPDKGEGSLSRSFEQVCRLCAALIDEPQSGKAEKLKARICL